MGTVLDRPGGEEGMFQLSQITFLSLPGKVYSRVDNVVVEPWTSSIPPTGCWRYRIDVCSSQCSRTVNHLHEFYILEKVHVV